MSKYTKEHYEDVARLFARQPTAQGIVHDFADLFAADNPPTCHCGIVKGADVVPIGMCCGRADMKAGHTYTGGFNREQFLAACGLEKYASPEEGYANYVAGKIAGEFE